MTIPLTGSGSLFVRLGHLFGGGTDVNSLRGSAINSTRVTSSARMDTRVVNTVEPDFAAGTPIPQIVQNLPTDLGSFQSAQAMFLNALAGGTSYARNVLTAMYNIDVKGVPNTAPAAALTALPAGGFAAVLAELIRQMAAAGASVQQATVSAGAQTAQGTPTGNPVINVSLKNGAGLALQFPYPETLTFKCTADNQTGGQAAGNEQVTVYGQNLVSDLLSQQWPQGSGITLPLSAVNGAVSNGQGNLLQNSDWTAFSTANAPDNWPILLGTAGTTIFNGGSGNAYTPGGGSLQFTGDGGGTLSSVAQPFNTSPSTALNAGGTSAKLVPDTVYHGCIFYKVSATPTAGAFQLRLLDGSGSVIADDQGTANSVTQLLTAATGTYASLAFAFRTPAVLPSTVKLNVRLSTAIDSGKSVYFGRLSFAKAAQLYASGPFATVHSGNVNLLAGLTPDTWTVAVSNNYSTSGSGLLHQWCARAWGLMASGQQLPVSGSPTVADSLVA